MALLMSTKRRYDLRNRFLKERLEKILPSIMQETDIDMWIVAAREHNEDPVMFSMLPATMMSARRTTVLVFVKRKDGSVEKMCMGRKNGGLDRFYRNVWVNQKDSNWGLDTLLMPDRDRNEESQETGNPEDIMECLVRLVKNYQPQKIGLNYSEVTAFGDGLSHSLYQKIRESLPPMYQQRIVSAEHLCVRWLETRLDSELKMYQEIVKKAHKIIRRGLSNEVIQPGKTTNKEVEYWLMEEGERQGFFNWFNTIVTLRREGQNIGREEVIQPGDLVHCDVGYQLMGYNYDSQANAYVLKPGEIQPPEGLAALYRESRQAQKTLMETFRLGMTGNEILKEAREKLTGGKLKPFIYVHPLGVHGHGAGPNIGRTDNQECIKGTGDHVVHNQTLFAMEMSVVGDVPEWPEGPTVIGLETETIFRDGHIVEIDPQEDLYLIRSEMVSELEPVV